MCAISPLSADSFKSIQVYLFLNLWSSDQGLSLPTRHAGVNDWTVRWITAWDVFCKELNPDPSERVFTSDKQGLYRPWSGTRDAFLMIFCGFTAEHVYVIFSLKSACKTLDQNFRFIHLCKLCFLCSGHFDVEFIFSRKRSNVITLDLKLKKKCKKKKKLLTFF